MQMRMLQMQFDLIREKQVNAKGKIRDFEKDFKVGGTYI